MDIVTVSFVFPVNSINHSPPPLYPSKLRGGSLPAAFVADVCVDIVKAAPLFLAVHESHEHDHPINCLTRRQPRLGGASTWVAMGRPGTPGMVQGITTNLTTAPVTPNAQRLKTMNYTSSQHRFTSRPHLRTHTAPPRAEEKLKLKGTPNKRKRKKEKGRKEKERKKKNWNGTEWNFLVVHPSIHFFFFFFLF